MNAAAVDDDDDARIRAMVFHMEYAAVTHGGGDAVVAVYAASIHYHIVPCELWATSWV